MIRLFPECPGQGRNRVPLSVLKGAAPPRVHPPRGVNPTLTGVWVRERERGDREAREKPSYELLALHAPPYTRLSSGGVIKWPSTGGLQH